MTVPTVRRATAEDASELTRLRVLMNTSMGHPMPEESFYARCDEVLRERLTSEDFVGMVVDRPDGAGLAASGCGWIDYHLPRYSDASGRIGFIASMSTDEDMRGRGYARAVLEALLAWFDEQGIRAIDLHASTFGEPLYRQYGFVEPKSRALSLSR